MTQLLSDFSSTDFYDRSYFWGKYGPVSDFNKAVNYTLKNFTGYVDQAKTAAATYPNIFIQSNASPLATP